MTANHNFLAIDLKTPVDNLNNLKEGHDGYPLQCGDIFKILKKLMQKKVEYSLMSNNSTKMKACFE